MQSNCGVGRRAGVEVVMMEVVVVSGRYVVVVSLASTRLLQL